MNRRHAIPRTVRFWIFAHGSRVRLSLGADESIGWIDAYRTDEGFHREEHVWERTGGRVVSSGYGRYRDCDGVTTRSWTIACPFAELDAHDVDGETCPMWETVDTQYRDIEAERAGY